MKIKLGKRTLTFVIIPDAGRKVVRFRISAFLLYLLPIILPAATLSAAFVIFLQHADNMKNADINNRLAVELAAKTAQYEQTLTSKELTISELKNEIIDISVQTEEMKAKVDELKRLEEEIRDVTEGEEVSSSNPARSMVTIASANFGEPRGIGGEEIEIHAVGENELLHHTKTDLTRLHVEVDDLIASITSAKEDLIAHLHQMRITPSIWPTVSTDISSTFGYRKDPFTRRSAFHAGVDIAGDRGDPIYATAEGVVTFAGYNSAYGYHVVIKHASGVSTRYAHMRKYLAQQGQLVKQGEQIGELGSTGRSTGPHLHYEVLKNGEPVDPMPYMKTGGKAGQ